MDETTIMYHVTVTDDQGTALNSFDCDLTQEEIESTEEELSRFIVTQVADEIRAGVQ